MHSHPNARLTKKDRPRLVTQHLEHGRNLAELAAESGISLRCAYRWLARYRSGGSASLADRKVFAAPFRGHSALLRECKPDG
jgi:transposase